MEENAQPAAALANEALMATRFRGFLPVAIDIETSGFDADRHAILELSAVTFAFRVQQLCIEQRRSWAVRPFATAVIEQESLQVTGIDLDDRERGAIGEKEAITALFKLVRKEVKRQGCQRAVLLGHNAAFDAGFLRKAVQRTGVKRDPFHPFTTLDTASIAAVSLGHTVLSEACSRAAIPYEKDRAHSALYDAERCALLFCKVVNDWNAASPGLMRLGR